MGTMSGERAGRDFCAALRALARGAHGSVCRCCNLARARALNRNRNLNLTPIRNLASAFGRRTELGERVGLGLRLEIAAPGTACRAAAELASVKYMVPSTAKQ